MSLKQVPFTEMLIAANRFNRADFSSWAFYSGMEFKAVNKWWGDRGPRDFPHEGLDFCLYMDRSETVRRLDASTRIPVMHDGVVKALFKDYLGKAIIIEHGNDPINGHAFLSAYAHTLPVESILPGVEVKQGEVIATIADTSHSKAKLLPHLHYSIARLIRGMDYENMVWNDMRDPSKMVLLDPRPMMDRPLRETTPE